MEGSSHSPASIGDLIIFDTPVLVDQLRTDCNRRRIETVNGLIRNSPLSYGRIVARRRNSGGSGGSGRSPGTILRSLPRKRIGRSRARYWEKFVRIAV